MFFLTNTTGSGTVDYYQLVIEGWPHSWVTDPRYAFHDLVTGRRTYPGLSYEGLRISERMVLRDAWPEVDGITARIVPTGTNEETLMSFTRNARAVAELRSDLDDGDTTWTTRPELAAGTYHVGTEAINDNGSHVLGRAYWDSQAQAHLTTAGYATTPVSVYDWPPTMEGRRVRLLAFTTTPGVGGPIWRGVVARPPRMDADGLSWLIEIAPITSVFDQNVGTGDQLEYRVRGVYHSNRCPLWWSVQLTDDGTAVVGPVSARGFYETQEGWAAAAVSPAIATALAAASGVVTNADQIESISYLVQDGTPLLSILKVAPGDDFPLRLRVIDALDGDITSDFGVWDPDSAKDRVPSGSANLYAGDKDGAWGSQAIISRKPPWSYPLPIARCLVGSPTFDGPHAGAIQRGYFAGDPDNNYPPDRIYLQSIDGLIVDDILVVKNGERAQFIRVTAIDSTERFITAEIIGHEAGIYISSDSVIVPARSYGESTNWAGFMSEVVDQAPLANTGTTPWITAFDCDPATWFFTLLGFPLHEFWQHRAYKFIKEARVRDVLASEMMVTGWMARLESDGRLGIALFPDVTLQRTPHYVITDDEILLPGEGLYGKWPSWEAQPDGLVNIAKLRLGYDPVTDEYDERGDYTVRMTRSIAEHKSGDKASQEISIRSTAAARFQSVVFNVGPVSVTPTDVVKMLGAYLRCLTEDYAVITIAVPFTLFGVLVGMIIEISCSLLPDGLGGRGLLSKKAICVGRTWELDPATGSMGELTLWLPRDAGRRAGYAPTGRVTAQDDLGSDTWELTCASGNDYNNAWEEDDGIGVGAHFAMGDVVEIVEVDSLTPARVSGTVTVRDGDIITVAFDSTWTPGSASWNLRFMSTGSTTARQLAYCWVADEDAQLVDDAAARLFT